jgi:hypothetical protein
VGRPGAVRVVRFGGRWPTSPNDRSFIEPSGLTVITVRLQLPIDIRSHDSVSTPSTRVTK